jgi:release factor glutamine methyltransferase
VSSPARHAAIVTTLRSAGCVFAEDEAALLIDAATSPADLDEMVARRASGLPLEQVLGWAEFCGLRIMIAPGVFVPRRRTELLVREAAALAGPGAAVLDLCCGSGAVGAAIAATIAGIELYAVDIDPACAECARDNIAVFGEVFEGDLYEPLPATLRGRLDVITANAPYVPSEEIRNMPPEARDHEPRVALDGGADGLDVQRRIAEAAQHWLAPGGHLLIETAKLQQSLTANAMTSNGLRATTVRLEETDATVVIGSLS